MRRMHSRGDVRPVATLVWILFPAASSAMPVLGGEAGDPTRQGTAQDALALVRVVTASESFELGEGTSRPKSVELVPSLRFGLDQSTTSTTPPSTSRSRYALPMVLSAIVPGAGEIASGHLWHGLPLVAIDVATWLGYADAQSEGNELQDAYEAFADLHWNEARWTTNLEFAASDSAGPNGWSSYWDPASPHNCDCSPPYIPREEDEREYYENLGKYNHFFPGWEDWNLEYDPESPAALRRQYVDMRIQSNDNYENAHTLLGIAAATRILSVIQSFWLVRRDGREEGLSMQPMTFKGLGTGLRLKWSF